MEWDAIPYEQIVWGEKLGAGSFGVVMKGTYLGIDVAIKEVLPSTDYEVAKYFEREWRIMREARHPNVVQYLGLSRAPPPDGRIFIISEFIDNGNLRSYIWDVRAHPTFPWRLRLSFATDIARALAYLHARKCIHRDLKGENLLITSNDRIKMTDFGFARITARNEDEMRRMSYCGTDGYMSPEILMGVDFDLPTDVFSLGIIFCEILSRKLVDAHTFAREVPKFGLDAAEVRKLASPGCPPALISLALDCAHVEPASRPTMDVVLRRLRAIELEVLARATSTGEHVGSLKLIPAGGRPGAGKRIPSFGEGIGKDIRTSSSIAGKPGRFGDDGAGASTDEEDAADADMDVEDLKEILDSIGKKGGALTVDGGTWRTARWGEDADHRKPVRSDFTAYTDASEMRAHDHLLSETTTYAGSSATSSVLESTATVVRPRPSVAVLPHHNCELETDAGGASSVLTIKGHPDASSPPDAVEPAEAVASASDPVESLKGAVADASLSGTAKETTAADARAAPPPASPTTITPPTLASPVTSAVLPPSAFTHRFTIVKPISAFKPPAPARKGSSQGQGIIGWAFSAAGLASPSGSGSASAALSGLKGQKKEKTAKLPKCEVCRMKVKSAAPHLRCDDCSSIVHVKCSANAPHNCRPLSPTSSTER